MKMRVELSQQDKEDLLRAISCWIENAKEDLDEEYFATMNNRMKILHEHLRQLKTGG